MYQCAPYPTLAQLQKQHGFTADELARAARVQACVVHNMLRELPVRACEASRVLAALSERTCFCYHLVNVTVPIVQDCRANCQMRCQQLRITVTEEQLQALSTVIDFFVVHSPQSEQAFWTVGMCMKFAHRVVSEYPEIVPKVSESIFTEIARLIQESRRLSLDLLRDRIAERKTNAPMHEDLRFTLEQVLFAHHISAQQIVEKAHLDLNTVGTIIKTRRGTAEELEAFFAAVSALAGQRYSQDDIYGMGNA